MANARPLIRSVAGATREAIKRSTRGVGLATARFRPPPDFLVIGAKRGGTTSFYFDLLDHPAIVPLFPPAIPVLKSVPTKGVHYFDSNAARSARWYLSHMPTNLSRRRRTRATRDRAVAGEASPYYLHHPAAAARAHELVPDARVIALLRNPIDRTYSHWKERRRGNAEPLGFEDALAAEPSRLEGERQRLVEDPRYVSYADEQQSYASQSLYADDLRPWLERFGRERTLVLASEDYYRDPNSVLTRVHGFLGLTPTETSTGRVLNEAPGTDVDPGIRTSLGERFAGPNAELERMLGQSFPWD